MIVSSFDNIPKEWTKDEVIEKLKDINKKGYIHIPKNMYRTDDGVVGQILEREFGVKENNLHLADLGKYELKGMRYKKNRPNILTLFHQKPTSGMTPIEIFNEFGYIKQSNRSNLMKKKLFTTIRGDKINRLGFILHPIDENKVELYNNDKYIASWDLTKAKEKIQQVILVFAETKGMTNSPDECFHYIKAFLLKNPCNFSSAISQGAVVMDFCIDQLADGSKPPHDRGPHIRISIKKLSYLFENVEEIL